MKMFSSNIEEQMPWEEEPLKERSSFARVFCPTNIALAKYWGKRDVALNLPTNSSISATLKDYGSSTTVEFHSDFKTDSLILNGKHESAEKLKKIIRVLNEVRKLAGVSTFAKIQSANNFPTGAGLASSASGLAAVAYAATKALRLDLSQEKISELARLGSGSACRSIFPGYVKWEKGAFEDGSDSVAHVLASAKNFPLRVDIAIVRSSEKEEASTSGMEHTKKTSPFFESWVTNANAQTDLIEKCILENDFINLAEFVESNCVRMHATAMSAKPPLVYWEAKTLEVMRAVREMRKKGDDVFFTIDAGPNVVVFSTPECRSHVFKKLNEISDIHWLSTEVSES